MTTLGRTDDRRRRNDEQPESRRENARTSTDDRQSATGNERASETTSASPSEPPRIPLGRHRARDGTVGGPVRLDVNRPHAAVIVGKRGTGKSHTLGVLAEGLAATAGVTPTVVDPMGEFGGIGREHDPPRVRPSAVPPRAWPSLVGLDPTSEAGGLVWRAVERADGVADALETLDGVGTDADPAVARVARNHLERAQRWDVFDPDGLDRTAFTRPEPLVLNCAGLPKPATNAVCRAVARGCYERRVAGVGARLPWLLVDEAHVAFDGVAAPGLRRLFTRGRTPGVSVVCATQRPSAVPEVVVSQADLVVAHAVRAGADRNRLVAARPDADRLRERIPAERGTAVVADDATETTVTVCVRDRRTADRGASPRASDFADRGACDDRPGGDRHE